MKNTFIYFKWNFSFTWIPSIRIDQLNLPLDSSKRFFHNICFFQSKFNGKFYERIKFVSITKKFFFFCCRFIENIRINPIAQHRLKLSHNRGQRRVNGTLECTYFISQIEMNKKKEKMQSDFLSFDTLCAAWGVKWNDVVSRQEQFNSIDVDANSKAKWFQFYFYLYFCIITFTDCVR